MRFQGEAFRAHDPNWSWSPLSGAGADTQGSCAPTTSAPDLSFQWTAPATGTYAFDTRGSTYDTVLYAHLGCMGADLGCNALPRSGPSARGGQFRIVSV